MYLRNAGAVCLFVAGAHLGWSQINTIEQQLRMWNDVSATLSNSDWVERGRFFANPPNENSFPLGDRVSLAQLRHKVPGKAMSAFSHGLKLAESGDFPGAAKDFERTTAIDPEYPDAHGNLGVMYINLGRLDQATGEFRRAIELDPSSSFHHANLALVLILLKLPKEAEAEAQTAVDLDHLNAKARYLLGSLLADHPETHRSALEHLTYAARQLPEAHLVLAEIYRREGSAALAQIEQDRYRKAVPQSVKVPVTPRQSAALTLDEPEERR